MEVSPTDPPLCLACGSSASLQCSLCEEGFYCSAQCQKELAERHADQCLRRGMELAEGRRSVALVQDMREALEGGARLLARGEVASAIDNLTLGIAAGTNAERVREAARGAADVAEEILTKEEGRLLADLHAEKSLALCMAGDFESAARYSKEAHIRLRHHLCAFGLPAEEEREVKMRAAKLMARQAHASEAVGDFEDAFCAYEDAADWMNAAQEGEEGEEESEFAVALRAAVRRVTKEMARSDWSGLIASLTGAKCGREVVARFAFPQAISPAVRMLDPSRLLVPTVTAGSGEHWKAMCKAGKAGTFVMIDPPGPGVFFDLVARMVSGDHISPEFTDFCATILGGFETSGTVRANFVFTNDETKRKCEDLMAAFEQLFLKGPLRLQDFVDLTFIWYSEFLPPSAVRLLSDARICMSGDWEDVPASEPVWAWACGSSSFIKEAQLEGSSYLTSLWKRKGARNPLCGHLPFPDMVAKMYETSGGTMRHPKHFETMVPDLIARFTSWIVTLGMVKYEVSYVSLSVIDRWFVCGHTTLRDSDAVLPPDVFLRSVIPYQSWTLLLPARLTGTEGTPEMLIALTGFTAEEWLSNFGLIVRWQEQEKVRQPALFFSRPNPGESRAEKRHLKPETLLKCWARMIIDVDPLVLPSGLVVMRPSQTRAYIRLSDMLADIAELNGALAEMLCALDGRKGLIARSRLEWAVIDSGSYSLLRQCRDKSLPWSYFRCDVPPVVLGPLDLHICAVVVRGWKECDTPVVRPTGGCHREDTAVSRPMTQYLLSLPAGAVAECLVHPMIVVAEEGPQVTKVDLTVRTADLRLGRRGAVLVYTRFSEILLASLTMDVASRLAKEK